MKIYGYCRISRASQSIERQHRNIKELYPEAILLSETFTGTKIEGRKEWNKLMKVIKNGDIIVFDSVSRMSRDADAGIELYEELMDKGVELIFIKEPHINTTTYKQAMENGIQLTGTELDDLLKGINKYLKSLARKQIKMAFEQAEKEVKDLQQRTREGLQTAKLNGKRVGTEQGRKLTTKKSVEAKEKIKKHARDFGGSLTDKEVMELCKIARNSYYKYKKEIIEELEKC
ncbi:MAG: recombinase family protein [Bacilli bacterium]